MEWLSELLKGESVSHCIFVVSLTAVLGLLIGSVKLGTVRLGVAGVLFSGIIVGHLGVTVHPEVLEFIREFGLVLFVYMVGLAIGPGFLSALMQNGLTLNLLALGIVLLGTGTAVLLHLVLGLDPVITVGLLTGATTNTPSLGAAQAALSGSSNIPDATAALPGVGYAIAYPFGILGILLVIWILRVVSKTDPEDAALRFRSEQSKDLIHLHTDNIVVQNNNLEGIHVHQIPAIDKLGVVVSRVMKADSTVEIVGLHTTISKGDVLHVVGSEDALKGFQTIVGESSEQNVLEVSENLSSLRLLVTNREIVGRSVGELNLRQLYGVTITRVFRGDVEFLVNANVRFQLGDRVRAVGSAEALNKAESILGNSTHELHEPNFIAVFLGLVLGIALGSLPIPVPGLPMPLKLGLAGGPLLVALLLGALGSIKYSKRRALSTYLPHSANLALKEFGIMLFLACVGIKAGGSFFTYLLDGDGLYWMFCGALITFTPLIIIGVIAMFVLRINYLVICGLLAGSMTDPPALTFASSLARSNAASVGYATVYPVVMFCRVLIAQLFVLLLI